MGLLGNDAQVEHVLSYNVRALLLAVEAYVHWVEFGGNAVSELLICH